MSECTRRGNSDHCLNELQRWARAAAINTNTRDGHEMLRLLRQPPRSLCASTGHYPHHTSQEPVQPATARVPWSTDNTWRTHFPRRTHGKPQPVATSQWPLLPQARPTFHTPPSPWGRPEWARAPESCYFNHVLSRWGIDALRWPTLTGGAKSKAEPQELCEQRREREISPSSLRINRLNLHNQLDVPCISGIPE